VFHTSGIPICASGTSRRVPRAITRQSHASVSAMPPPTFSPSTAAIVICGTSSQALHMRAPQDAIVRCSSIDLPSRLQRAGSFRSTPAENSRAVPVSTTQVTLVSSLKPSAMRASSCIAHSDSALRRSPRS